jgi:hypothetical protein
VGKSQIIHTTYMCINLKTEPPPPPKMRCDNPLNERDTNHFEVTEFFYIQQTLANEDCGESVK